MKVYVVQYYGSGDLVAVFKAEDEAWVFADELDPDGKMLSVEEQRVFCSSEQALEEMQ